MGLSEDGGFYLKDEHTKWFKKLLGHKNTRYVNNATLKWIWQGETNPFSPTMALQHAVTRKTHECSFRFQRVPDFYITSLRILFCDCKNQ